MRVLVVGWSSVLHGEATAGDVLSMAAVSTALRSAGVACTTAWSAVMCPPGGLALDDADPADFTHVVWACGPLHGSPIEELHRRFAGCVRLAVGVSVLDPDDPAVRGFDTVIARDLAGGDGRRDLAARPVVTGVPVVAVFLTHGQQEYAGRRRHEAVNAVLGRWLRGADVARLDLDTRLDPRDWRSATTAGQVESVIRRVDAVVTTRLHGLVLALKNGIPAVAVDPVAGGAKVTAQAHAWGWPVIAAESIAGHGIAGHGTGGHGIGGGEIGGGGIGGGAIGGGGTVGDEVAAEVLDAALAAALSPTGRAAAAAAASSARDAGAGQLAALLDRLAPPPAGKAPT